MKNIKRIFKNCGLLLLFAGLAAFGLSLNSCDNKDDSGNCAEMAISKVFLEDAKSSVTDREVTFARLGQVIRLEGSGFTGVEKIYFNGVSASFNTALMTDNNIWVQVPSRNVPIMDAASNVRNTIILEKGGTQYVYNFVIMAASPTITNVSHTMPKAGDVIILTGTNLQGITQVTFPGGAAGTNITSDDEEGTWCRVTVPDMGDNSGAILVVGANGGGYSPAYINFKEGLLNDFDAVDNYQWGSEIDNTKLSAVIPASGDCKSQGNYSCFNSGLNIAAGGVQKFWLNSDKVMPAMSNLPASTPVDQCGIQMDIYVEGAWNSGLIRFVMADGWGNDRYCMLYQPVYPGGTSYDASAFVNPGCWFTITLPFSLSNDFTGKTLGDVIAQMGLASYKQMGPFFENSGIRNVFDPVVATEKIYFDNIRIVPLSTPAYSDFSD